MPHVNKKTTSEKWKFNSNKKLGIEWAVNGLGKPFRKKSDPKNRKNSKNQSEIAACEQKTTTEKPNFCSNTIFALYFKIRAKNSRRKTTRFFALFTVSAWPKSLLQFDFKNHENVWTDLKKKKKRQRPNTIQILWIVKRALQYSSAQLTAIKTKFK